MDTPTPLSRAIGKVGLMPLSKALNLTYQALRRWEKQGRLPRTEWTGETDYARQIEQLTAGEVSRDELLDWGRRKSCAATAEQQAA